MNEFLDFDSILIGLNIRKEFIGSGFHNGEVVRKLSDNTLKVRYEDNDQEDLEVEEVLRFHMFWKNVNICLVHSKLVDLCSDRGPPILGSSGCFTLGLILCLLICDLVSLIYL